MWYDYLEENFFIKKIFKIVPDLKSITCLLYTSSDIQITMENELIRFSSMGTIDMDFNAEAGVIQSIKIYY